MATRMAMYRDQDPATVMSPTFTPTAYGSWGADFAQYYALAPDGYYANGSVLGRTINTAAVSSTYLHAVCISPPIPAGVTFTAGSTTWQFVFRCREASSSHNCFMCAYISLLENDGTLIDTSSLITDDTEFAVSASTYTSRNRAAATISGLSTYTTLGGERIQFEIGMDKQAAVSGIIAMSHGYSGTFMTASDAATTNSPWLECSETWTFDPEGTTYNQSTSKLMLMGVG